MGSTPIMIFGLFFRHWCSNVDRFVAIGKVGGFRIPLMEGQAVFLFFLPLFLLLCLSLLLFE